MSEQTAGQSSKEEATSTTPSLSLADRITQPNPISTEVNKTDGASAPEQAPKPTSWADDVTSPMVPNSDQIKKDDSKENGADTAPRGQVDGAGVIRNGSQLQEPDYEVEVKLSDIQADPNNPLYSVKSFEELGGL